MTSERRTMPNAFKVMLGKAERLKALARNVTGVSVPLAFRRIRSQANAIVLACVFDLYPLLTKQRRLFKPLKRIGIFAQGY